MYGRRLLGVLPLIFGGIVVVFIISLVSQFYLERQAFQKALAENTEQAFLTFCSHYPHSPYAFKAQRLAELRAYAQAEKQNSIQGWRTFLSRYPSSSYARFAKRRIQQLLAKEAQKKEEEKQWDRALSLWREAEDVFPDPENRKGIARCLHAIQHPVEIVSQSAEMVGSSRYQRIEISFQLRNNLPYPVKTEVRFSLFDSEDVLLECSFVLELREEEKNFTFSIPLPKHLQTLNPDSVAYELSIEKFQRLP
ncbi:hypothetical protein J7L13_03775 [bacterium]|nr:hypothetical protein [bacterium]